MEAILQIAHLRMAFASPEQCPLLLVNRNFKVDIYSSNSTNIQFRGKLLTNQGIRLAGYIYYKFLL
jgi:hypothetical protein